MVSTVFASAGEPSGDLIGSLLVKGLLDIEPNIQLKGIVGPHMQQAGCETWHSCDVLAVRGYLEALSSLPQQKNSRQTR